MATKHTTSSRRIGTVSVTKVDWDLLKDQAELLGQIQDYLKRDWSAAKKWISAVEGILNLLAALRPTSERHNRREAAGLRAIEQFRKHLASDKFRGTERDNLAFDAVARIRLKAHDYATQGLLGSADLHAAADAFERYVVCRKDWISTSDVLNWLRNIEDSLKDEDHEIREGWR